MIQISFSLHVHPPGTFMVFCFCAGKGKSPLPDKVILAQKREISILKIGKKIRKSIMTFCGDTMLSL